MPSQPQLKITVGCDPEVFLKDQNDSFVSAYGIIPGTKENPFPTSFGAVQVDGVAAEFNTTPAGDAGTFALYVEATMKDLQAFVPNHSLKMQPVAIFNKTYWKTVPEESRALGCNPDWNAWTGAVNPPPDDNGEPMRTGSGHIHVGWTQNQDINDPMHQVDCMAVIKQMDYYIGLYSLLWDTDARRRKMYGKAGAHRRKSYGAEYRTPSNAWLRHRTLYPWLFTAAYYAVHGLITDTRPAMFEKYGNKAQEVIDNNDLDFVKSSEFKKMHEYTGLQWPKW